MKLQSLDLTNYRCFQNIHIDFHSGDDENGGLTVFVARNGEGKTAILDAINVAWGPFVGKMPDSTGAGFKKTDAHLVMNERSQMVESGRPQVRAFFSDGIQVLRAQTASKKKQTTTIKDARAIIEYADRLLADKYIDRPWPLIAYYGDNRLGADNVLTRGHIEAVLNKDREYGYADATNPKSGYKEFIQWFAHLEFSLYAERYRSTANNEKLGFDEKTLRRYESFDRTIKDAVHAVLSPSGWSYVDFDLGTNKIFAFNEAQKERIDVASLSTGVRVTLGMVADIAYRCCKLNSYLEKEILSGTPGIVLIDEIELHLHPGWQQQILPSLRKIFPKIQFIVTTHSPQVVSSVPKECVRIIDNGGIVPFDVQTQGVVIGDLLEKVFRTYPDPQSLEIVTKLNRLSAMVTERLADTPEWNALYQELELHFGANYAPLAGIVLHKQFLAKLNLE